MQRLLRKVGRLSSSSSSKSRHDNSVNVYSSDSRVIIGGGGGGGGTGTVGVEPGTIPEAKSTNCVANGTMRVTDEVRAATNGVSDENLTTSSSSSKPSQTKKKRNSLIESFRKLRRHSRSKELRRSVASISETVPPPRVNKEIQPEVGVAAATGCEGETVGDDQCPSTREVSVNGDVTSLSLSVLTLRSLGSAEAAAAQAFPRTDASSEVAENVGGDAGRAEFLAREVPGPVVLPSDQDAQLASLSGNVEENRVSSELISISISLPLVSTRHKFDPPSTALLSSADRGSPSALLSELGIQQSGQLSTHSLTGSNAVERGGATLSRDDLGEDGNRIHDTLPVDLLYSPIESGNEFSEGVSAGHLSATPVFSKRTDDVGVIGHEDFSSSGEGSGKWSLMHELTQLSKHGWYWGPISREEAEEKLTDQPEGAFLIRDSTDERYLFSLSFRSFNRTLHTRIEYCNGEFSFYHLPHSEGYRSLIDLIENAIHDSLNGIFYYSRSNVAGSHSYAVKLTKPVSRFTQVRSLQYLCRFIIRQHTRVDHIQNLPLPVTVKSWLQENQY